MVNKFIGIGHLCEDPKAQEFGEKKKCSFSIAINNTKSDVLFMPVECWNNVAENCNKFLQKGSCCYVEGKIKCSKWKDKSGTQRTNYFISADMIRFLPNGKKDTEKSIKQDPPPSNIANIISEEESPF